MKKAVSVILASLCVLGCLSACSFSGNDWEEYFSISYNGRLKWEITNVSEKAFSKVTAVFQVKRNLLDKNKTISFSFEESLWDFNAGKIQPNTAYKITLTTDQINENCPKKYQDEKYTQTIEIVKIKFKK